MRQLPFEYDGETDVATICGIKYAGDVFRALGFAEPGTWLRIEDRKDGVVTVFSVHEVTEKTFDAISGRGLPCLPLRTTKG